MGNKYHAKITRSALCNRVFASQKECRRGEELCLLEKGGVIEDLQYQVKFVLCEKPRISITVDFVYTENGVRIYEDSKGVMARDFRVKMAWIKEQKGIEVILS